ncbi:retrovirus-related pol polyprotein from transposon TNT 1-94 [Tanacetum coccineum]
MDVEQAFWFRISNPTIESYHQPPVKVEVPSELPKVSLVNASLKKLKFHLAQFDSVVKKRTTPDARTEGEWGFEHTKAVFNNEIIPFLKSLKYIFNVFDRDLLNEIMEVETVFDQMDADDIIKSMREKSKEENVKYDYCEIETKNVELGNRVAKLLSENEHLCNEINHVKQVFKEQFDLIKETCVRSKEQRKEIVDIAPQIPSANTIVPGMFKLDLEPLAPRIEVFYYSKSAKKHKKQNIWKPTGHVFTEVGFKWKLIGKTFTIVGNLCPLTRITSANVVPPKKTPSHSVETQKPELKVYSRKTKTIKNVGSSKKAKIVEFKNANHSEPNHTWGSNATDIPSPSFLVMIGTVGLGNDHIVRIMGYGDYQLGNVTISRVYYVEGLGHNLFSVGQFCDGDLEVAFRKNTCFIGNLEGVDLLSGSCDTNLYTISLEDMLKTSLIPIFYPKCQILRAGYGTVDNGTEFVNQTLHEFYENVGISHQTSVTRSPQQNDVVERRNRTLIEAARTISGPGLQCLTPAISNSRLVPNLVSQQPCIPPPRDD